MRKAFILLSILLAAENSKAQTSMADCVKNVIIHTGAGKNPFEEWRSCVLEKPLPVFAATTISGDTIETDKLKNKIVVINFWFIDCHPCIAEIPGLNRLVQEYKGKDIVFLAITWETTKRIIDFLPKNKLDFIIVPDAKSIIDKMVASGYPTTYIVNQQGIIKEAWSGGRVDEQAGTEYYEKARPVIEDMLKNRR